MKVSVIGLGKLGLCTAACFAASGHTVYGYDSNSTLRSLLKQGGNPIHETGLISLLASAWSSLHVVDGCQMAAAYGDVILIIVPTPSLPDGQFSNDYVVAVLEELAPALQAKETFSVIAVVSTVMPGSCDKIFRPLLERMTGKSCGTDFGLVYNPEFIALGSVIHNFTHPDMVLIGASDDRSAETVRRLYASTCKSRPVMSVMSLINAEITKISLNCFVTMKISYANRLAGICENVSGADVDVITAAIGADTRVGSKCLKGGLGFGGPCFPRDNIAFQAFAEEHEDDAGLGRAVVAVNGEIPHRLYRKIASHCSPPAKIALLGLSYKPHTHIVEESHSLRLATLLSEAGYRVVLHDPQALASAEKLMGGSARYCCDPYECLAGASAAALLTDWPEYRALDWQRIGSLLQPGALVIDSWRIARNRDLGGLHYHPIGIGMPNKEGLI